MKKFLLLAALILALFSIGYTQGIRGGGSGSGSGDVTGPASSTDNAVARFDGTGGKTLQDSGCTVNDTGDLTCNTVTATATGPLTLTGSAGASPTASGTIDYDTTSHTLEYGTNGTNRTVVNTNEAQSLSAKTLTTPIITGKVDRNNVAVDDDDCTGEQGLYWYDTTDSQFEFCNANSGTPTVLGGAGAVTLEKYSPTCGDRNNGNLDIGAGWYTNATTGTPAGATIGGSFFGTNDNMICSLLFDAAADERATYMWRIPANWNAGTINLHFNTFWNNPEASTQIDVEVSTVCRANAEALSFTFNAAQNLVIPSVNVNNSHGTNTLSTITTTGCAAGETMWIKIVRDADDATNDTYTFDWELAAMTIEYTVQ